MKKKLFITLFFLISLSAIAAPKTVARINKWQILMNLINQEVKTINKVKKKSISLRKR